jgi:hypothetical protein
VRERIAGENKMLLSPKMAPGRAMVHEIYTGRGEYPSGPPHYLPMPLRLWIGWNRFFSIFYFGFLINI